jgi:hypothetical protein
MIWFAGSCTKDDARATQEYPGNSTEAALSI